GPERVLPRRQKTDWFWYWLRTRCGFPDGNMCVRRSVLLDCMPWYRLGTRVVDNLGNFYYNFNTRGFLAHGIGVVATFASVHDHRISTERERDLRMARQDNCRRVRRYRGQLLEDQLRHVFRDGAGRALGAVPPLRGRIVLEDLLVRTEEGKLVDGIELLASTC
ncbi:MAG: hypothetical protein ABGY41_13485, partial [Candidatus Poribacteria bacterium]